MADTLWGHRRPGQAAVGSDELGGYVLYGEPDRIRLPVDLGGAECRVTHIALGKCPCKAGHEVKTYSLEGTDLRVSECDVHGFLWWKPRAPSGG